MIGQNDNRLDRKWVPHPRVAKCGAQQTNMFDEELQSAVG
jgi:hypothetical protein